MRPAPRGEELLCLRPRPGRNRRLTLPAERQLGPILHVVRPELLELALPEPPVEPDPVPLGNRGRRVGDPGLTGGRQGACRIRTVAHLAREGHELPPLKRAGIPVIVLGYFAVTEPTGRLPPLAG